MSREELHDLILGGVLIVLGYAVYHHQQALQSAKQPAAPIPQPALAAGAGAGAASAGAAAAALNPFADMNTLLAGTTHNLGGSGMSPSFMSGFMDGFMQ